MAKKLINKITRGLTDKEAQHILTKIWGYDLQLVLADAYDAEERRFIKAEQFGEVRSVINGMFSDKLDASNLDYFQDEYMVDEGGLSLKDAMQTFNYLHKIGALI